MTAIHNFKDSLTWSHAQEDQPFWSEVYEKAFPTMVHYQSTRQDGWAQRGGIDRTVLLADGTTIKIDEKVRREDYPDILIEHWSDEARRIPGWGHRAKALTCDYIAYALIPSQTCYLLPYQVLRRAIKLNGLSWWQKAELKEPGYRKVIARNTTYQTVSYVVPTDVILDAIRDCLVIRWGS